VQGTCAHRLTRGLGVAVQDNVNSFVDRDDLLLTLPTKEDEAPVKDPDLIHRYFHTAIFLNNYRLDSGEPLDKVHNAFAPCLGHLACATLRTDDLWYAQIAHRLLIWSAVSSYGAETGNDGLLDLAHGSLRQFLEKSLSSPHSDTAGAMLLLLRMMRGGRD
jgi:hypothetical protein